MEWVVPKAQAKGISHSPRCDAGQRGAAEAASLDSTHGFAALLPETKGK